MSLLGCIYNRVSSAYIRISHHPLVGPLELTLQPRTHHGHSRTGPVCLSSTPHINFQKPCCGKAQLDPCSNAFNSAKKKQKKGNTSSALMYYVAKLNSASILHTNTWIQQQVHYLMLIPLTLFQTLSAFSPSMKTTNIQFLSKDYSPHRTRRNSLQALHSVGKVKWTHSFVVAARKGI